MGHIFAKETRMLQAFIILAREGLESFLIVAVILAYLKKTGRKSLAPAVYTGIVASILLSMGVGSVLMSVANQSLWEGILGVVAVVMVASLVIHMWRVGPQMKSHLERRMSDISAEPAKWSAIVGFFLFTLLMITREGMETALMLFQVKNQPFIIGGLLGLAAAAGLGWFWVKFSRFINLKRFFQITGAYLLIFTAQTALYSFHELCEAGVFSQSDLWHAATEPYSPDGMYGKWFSFITILGLGTWLIVAALREKIQQSRKNQAASDGSSEYDGATTHQEAS